MPDEMAAFADCITKENVQSVAKSVVTDTIYFLSGKEEADSEE